MGGRLLEGPTMVGRTSDWKEELGRFLKPFLDRLGHKVRRQMCPLYVSGLIGPGDRKSIQPNAGYGLSAPFRQGLTARRLTWAVGIPRQLKVYTADVRMIWPVAKRGRPRQRHVPDILSIPAEDMLADAKWRTISWRT